MDLRGWIKALASDQCAEGVIQVIALALSAAVLAVYLLTASVVSWSVNAAAVPGWHMTLLLWLFGAVLAFSLLALVVWVVVYWCRRNYDNRNLKGIRWSWAVLVLPLLPPFFVLIALQILLAAPRGGLPPKETRYGAIIDAGSSGSRIFLFKWQIADDDTPHVEQVASFNDEDVDDQRKKCPLTRITIENKTCDCLVKLIQRARGKAPGSLSFPISLWVKATAGVRKMGVPEQGRTLEAADKCLAGRADYAWRGAEAISGEREGVYAWLAVNFLAQKLQVDAAAATLGIVEIGGQSAQIAYRVSGPTDPAPTLGKIVTLFQGSRELNVYSVSDLLGKNAALCGLANKRTTEKCETLLKTDEPFPKECALMGNSKKCLDKIRRFVCSSDSRGEDCQRYVQNMVPPTEMRFVALSNFIKRSVPKLGLEDNATLEDVRYLADVICSSGQSKEGERAKRMARINVAETRKDVCFDAFYTTQLAHHGWAVPLRNVSRPDSRWDEKSEPSWPLGAMLFEAGKLARLAHWN